MAFLNIHSFVHYFVFFFLSTWGVTTFYPSDDKCIHQEQDAPKEDVDFPVTANATTTNDRTLKHQNGIQMMHCSLIVCCSAYTVYKTCTF